MIMGACGQRTAENGFPPASEAEGQVPEDPAVDPWLRRSWPPSSTFPQPRVGDRPRLLEGLDDGLGRVLLPVCAEADVKKNTILAECAVSFERAADWLS